MKRTGLLVLTLCAVVMTTGCFGLIANGTDTKVAVASTPSQAAVVIDGSQQVKTPATVTLSNKTDHTLEFSKEGYAPATAVVKRKTSGLIALDVLFLPGFIIDFATGGAYTLTPTEVHVLLEHE